MPIKVLDIEPFWVYGIGTKTVKSIYHGPHFFTIEDLDHVATQVKRSIKVGLVGGYLLEQFDIPRLSTKKSHWKRPPEFSHQILDVEVSNGRLKVLIRPVASRSGYALAWIRKNHLQMHTVVSGWSLPEGIEVSSLDLIYDKGVRKIEIIDELPRDPLPKEFTVKLRLPQAYNQRYFCLEYGIFGSNDGEVLTKVNEILKGHVRECDGVFEEGKKVEVGEYQEIDA